MTIPLDRLYHFVENIAEKIHGDSVIIYRFWPNGSKNLEDVKPFREYTWEQVQVTPHIWCHDQEPLNYEFYCATNRDQWQYLEKFEWNLSRLSAGIGIVPDQKNFHSKFKNWFEKNLLLHSEKRSTELEKYLLTNELIPIYYWNHALLALDWYRYARLESFSKRPKKTFLIYNRAWSGTREYRLKFVDLLVDKNLINHCQTNFNSMDPEKNLAYTEHDFKNNIWKPKNTLENFFVPTLAGADSSANFITTDYELTNIEIVLETLFDDNRLHLTEKSLRPIACEQPFILAATHGSLEYLRSYGFETFGHVWNEDYDKESDSYLRLNKIIDLMQEIVNLDSKSFNDMLQEARQIAIKNRKWFFSQDFFHLVIDELKVNLQSGLTELQSCNNYLTWLNSWKHWLSHAEIREFIEKNTNKYEPTKDVVYDLIKSAQSRLTNI
jgi:hypothetical protein